MEYIFQAMFSHKFIRQYSDALLYFVVEVLVAPHPFQPFNRVYLSLWSSHLHQEVRVSNAHGSNQFFWSGRLLDVAKDSFSIVFGYILCIILLSWVVEKFIFGKFFTLWLCLKFNRFLRLNIGSFPISFRIRQRAFNIKGEMRIERLVK